MNIILGKQAADKLSQKYTVLELDTFRFKHDDEPVQSYCVVEITDFQDLENSRADGVKHGELITNYQSGNWDETLTLIDELYGSWNGEVDSFYDVLKSRIEEFKSKDDDSWNYVIDRTAG